MHLTLDDLDFVTFWLLKCMIKDESLLKEDSLIQYVATHNLYLVNYEFQTKGNVYNPITFQQDLRYSLLMTSVNLCYYLKHVKIIW